MRRIARRWMRRLRSLATRRLISRTATARGRLRRWDTQTGTPRPELVAKSVRRLFKASEATLLALHPALGALKLVLKLANIICVLATPLVKLVEEGPEPTDLPHELIGRHLVSAR